MTLMLSRDAEPIPGYTLCERIGAGGYGEVWKADAPGGLTKAVKIVFGCMDGERAACELKALNRVKEVRHPFLLSLERIEVVDSQLVIVTELAEASLKDRFEEAKAEGLPGIPREELLVYIRDAADALDHMCDKFSLQHLDIKPENLLIVGGRVKVADFGLVKDIHDATMSLMGGMTPIYAPPEVFDARPSLHSDQYSLAIVYQEMLTGVLPFPGQTAAQLTIQHLSSPPRLGPLPTGDREAIARALSKSPADRFNTCVEMAESLLRGTLPPTPAGPAPSVATNRPVESPGTGSGDSRAAMTLPGSPAELQSNRSGSETMDYPQRPPAGSRDALEETCPHERSIPVGQTPPPASLPEVPKIDLSWLTPPESPGHVETLEPFDILPEEKGIRPTLIVGIGGIAARTLKRFYRRFHDRFGDMAKVPAFGMLLIDTDHHTIAEAVEAGTDTAVPLTDTLAVPLRQRQDYRDDSDKFLRWLSRRWLYNIPRSLKTEGLRPLGRLALVDHSVELFDRLRQAIVQISTPEALAASVDQTGLPARCEAPRVFLVASISGGTGSGMVLDLAYAVRMILADEGVEESEVCGILAHSTSRHPDAKDLARANAFACLTELNHYSREGRYPGDSACGLPAVDENIATFDETYLVHLGDDMNQTEYDAAADALAEYLYLDVATESGAFFDKCRKSSSPDSRSWDFPLQVRTLGISQIGCSQEAVPSAATEILCQEVIQRWRGHGQATDGNPTTEPTPDSPSVEGADDLELTLDHLVDQVEQAARAELGSDLTTYLQARVDEETAKWTSEGSATGPPSVTVQILNTMNIMLGAQADTDRPLEIPPSPLRLAVDAGLRELATQWDKKVSDWILRLVDRTGARVRQAQQSEAWAGERLRCLEVETDASLKQLKTALVHAEDLLVNAGGGLAAMNPFKSRKPRINRRWVEHFELRLHQAVLRGVDRLIKAIRTRVSAVADQLKLLNRELNELAGEFRPSDSLEQLAETEQTPSESLSRVRRSLIMTLQEQIPELAKGLEARFQDTFFAKHGELCSVLEKGIQLRRLLTEELRVESRKAVVVAIGDLDVAGRLFANEDEEADETSVKEVLAEFVDEVTPELFTCGAAQRLMVVCPRAATKASREQLEEACQSHQPSFVRDSDGDVVLCCEAEQIPLSQAAAYLIDYRADYAEVASRLHTRVDVAWSGLPPIE